MSVPRLLLVTDPMRTQLPLPELVAGAVAGGVDAIYLRHLAPDDDLPGSVVQIREVVGPHVLLLVPSEPPEGVPNVGRHLRERDPLPGQSGHRWPYLASRSIHSPVEAARSNGVDFVVAGHVFPSASKPGRSPLGLDGLTGIVTAAPCPVVAIGGITPERVSRVISAGAQGVAVIGAICEALDPFAAARELRAAVDAALAPSRKE